ncbi:RsmB/NOP family class I SAM-dependent RNA methyltransferase [Hydrogenophilus thermoluteolus]|uniref:SAM-dependent methyltransferase n=1 Tax=Hydrogenophilus thermoluteolus TaxID=297 RepID=A0A2Z6DWC8_HYDTE|nr:RsmB/NOP family class I SAM-dependent RNA methyltransferase [Hydrogenophilus thermoluteolus]BBD76712.1 SAM-dependent methyltransferase [Hydrogenophilus thermoluteolus]HNQ48219.1 RsmB/NOP family class I SAM-dependent RNA methyltransferase [Hydrogenophilus thermoluteolus]HNU18757.1 RsmB/NOP family class I SAM-dependent RNA methyltransferase [Hydrogenophilus thermoluteolus]
MNLRAEWHPQRVQAVVQALSEALTFAAPADKVLSAFLRAWPRLGQRDRAWVAETYYGVIRHYRRLTVWAESTAPRHLLLAWLVVGRGVSVAQLAPLLRREEGEWLAQRKAAIAGYAWRDAERLSMPDWLWARLVTAYGVEETQRIASSMLQPAPLDLRVNTLKAKRSDVMATFMAEGLEAHETPWSPWGVRLAEKVALQRHPLYRDGIVEVQDEGSQLVTRLVAPKRRQTVVDFCAGAGGKTLVLAALMVNSGQIYACDAIAKRLAGLHPRLARAGATNVQPMAIADEHDPKLARLAGKADRVLVDVPCSGIGTLRRNPDFKWRQTEATVAALTAQQASILAAAARLVKPGGRLIYVTCSILPEENDRVVQTFLAAHPAFAPLPWNELTADWQHGTHGTAFVNGPCPTDGVPEAVRLFPHVHGCDGFFAVVLERRSV